MSLYNMMCGFNPACIFVLPMLGRESGKYPRFRDCFITDDKERVLIYTRVGGGNRGCGFGEEELYKDPYFVRTYDDDFDTTYGYYEFNVPDKWKVDFDCIVAADFKSVSDEYIEYVKGFYPELAKEGVIDNLFERGNQDPDQGDD